MRQFIYHSRIELFQIQRVEHTEKPMPAKVLLSNGRQRNIDLTTQLGEAVVSLLRPVL